MVKKTPKNSLISKLLKLVLKTLETNFTSEGFFQIISIMWSVHQRRDSEIILRAGTGKGKTRLVKNC